ncbi:DUF6428 family protein [Gracilimonas mengyeensis]|uniref:Uncharacterized protein n=1 Tax=Gracilimonas mengyeensis TaxID=1302730 RepID=A0A521BKS8_9BACT|nr:DUF6428 family protein [Gracilimonas mengyeensis]SMO47699.1 hypothetical protein SAMN06265219_102360 [Gracilimonas mengyeensis]
MNTSTFIHTLISNSNKELYFTLPDGSRIAGDLHITEIQNHQVDSVDCGGNMHAYQETVVQLWINERSGKTAEWTTDKAIKIIDIVGKKIEYIDDAELFIEFGDSAHPTMKYSVKEVEADTGVVNIHLNVKPTVCKPSLTQTTKAGACC